MKTSNRFNLTLISKIATVGLIIFMFFTLMIPIYQIGENHAYRMRIAQAKSSIMELEEIERTLESEISYAKSAEALIDKVVEYNLEYSEINPSSTLRIARSSSV